MVNRVRSDRDHIARGRRHTSATVSFACCGHGSQRRPHRPLDRLDDSLDLVRRCVEQLPAEALMRVESLRWFGEVEAEATSAQLDFDRTRRRRPLVEQKVLEAVPPELGRISERSGRDEERGGYTVALKIGSVISQLSQYPSSKVTAISGRAEGATTSDRGTMSPSSRSARSCSAKRGRGGDISGSDVRGILEDSVKQEDGRPGRTANRERPQDAMPWVGAFGPVRPAASSRANPASAVVSPGQFVTTLRRRQPIPVCGTSGLVLECIETCGTAWKVGVM